MSMHVIVCGAGQVGGFAAEILAHQGHSITVIDVDKARLRTLGDTLDVSIFEGNGVNASILREAGAAKADLLLAATTSDEVNLLTSSIAKSIGTKRTIARVHSSVFYESIGLDYGAHFHIDGLICPESAAAEAIANTLRNPGAHAIETFGRGQIEMHEIPVSPGVEAIGKPLSELRLPAGSRLLAVIHDGRASSPTAQTTFHQGDTVVLVANSDTFSAARKLFYKDKIPRKRIAILGADATTIWLARALRERAFAVKLFVTSRDRAEELAQQLSWVTVVNADPTDPAIFEEENLREYHAFVALTHDDEDNILACAFAKSRGLPSAYAIVQKRRYLHLLEHVAIDEAFSPRLVAAKQVIGMLDDSGFRRIAVIEEGVLEAYAMRIGASCSLCGTPLFEITDFPGWIVAAIEHNDHVSVPDRTATFSVGDRLIVVGPPAIESKLRKTLTGR
ncbi:MAG: Trk system potassium transporter TrkA [Phycisphaeraceae bacterium]|nr:Trk system potassium transporter TrkA [Phycisphaerales bacterium]MCB9861340.1 Trk system potassium transporter TrkA [Phycisphaeraceae bacterium]